MSNNSIWPIDKTLSDATTPGQSGHGIDGNEGVLYIRQNSSITESSSSDCFVSYPGHSLKKFYPSAEMQSATPPDLATRHLDQMGLSGANTGWDLAQTR